MSEVYPSIGQFFKTQVLGKLKAEMLADDSFAHEVYAALCNMRWRNKNNPGAIYAVSWRHAGGVVAQIRGLGENYMDFYCSGREGRVSERVLKALGALGWEPWPYDDNEA
jgi:hypothetical protein